MVQCLEKEGVDVIFGIPGGVNLPFFDKLYDSRIRVILTRHEQGAAHMADGYTRSSGRVGVCTATSGPGATNLITGLATAHMDSIPLVAITGQVRTDAIGSDAFQEADATGCTRPVTKHNFLVKDVKDLARTMREAFYIATSGRPGPVHVDVPVDVQRAKTEFIYPEKVHIRSYNPTIKGHPLQIKKAVELFKAAERPLLYVGGGVTLSGSSGILKEIAEKSGGLFMELDQFSPEILKGKAKRFESARSDQVRKALWMNPWVFGLLILFLVGEWGYRRYRGDI